MIQVRCVAKSGCDMPNYCGPGGACRLALMDKEKHDGLDTKHTPSDNREHTKVEVPSSILDEAKRIIYGDREKTYGSPDRNLKTIADMWTNYMRAVGNTSIQPISVNDVCIMMILLKVARLASQPTHHDSLVDLAGYAALMERVQNHVKTSGNY